MCKSTEASNLFSVSEYTIKTLPYCCSLTIILAGLGMQPVSIHLGSKKKTNRELLLVAFKLLSRLLFTPFSIQRGVSPLYRESPITTVEKHCYVQTPALS